MRAAARRPLAVGLIVAALALVGAAFALRLHPSAGTDTLVGRSSDSYRATSELHARFGDDPVIVLVREAEVGLEALLGDRAGATA